MGHGVIHPTREAAILMESCDEMGPKSWFWCVCLSPGAAEGYTTQQKVTHYRCCGKLDHKTESKSYSLEAEGRP